jgi:DNA-binding TFAR19-related protein (PDSD5 family)
VAVFDAATEHAPFVSSPAPRAFEDEQAREALIDSETAELNQLLDRIDGLTHEARRRLRRLEHHRRGVSVQWTDLHG